MMLSALVAGLGCATDRPPVVTPAPPPHVIQMMGYDEAVQLGSSYVKQLGYSDVKLEEASPFGVNLWRVQFGLSAPGKGKRLVLEFDGASRKLVNSNEVAGVRAVPVPLQAP